MEQQLADVRAHDADVENGEVGNTSQGGGNTKRASKLSKIFVVPQTPSRTGTVTMLNSSTQTPSRARSTSPTPPTLPDLQQFNSTPRRRQESKTATPSAASATTTTTTTTTTPSATVRTASTSTGAPEVQAVRTTNTARTCVPAKVSGGVTEKQIWDTKEKIRNLENFLAQNPVIFYLCFTLFFLSYIV